MIRNYLWPKNLQNLPTIHIRKIVHLGSTLIMRRDDDDVGLSEKGLISILDSLCSFIVSRYLEPRGEMMI